MAFLNNIRKTGGLFLQGIAYSNLWISLGALFFAAQTYILFNIKWDYYLLAFVFCATFLTYNFQRYVKLKKGQMIQGSRYFWMKNHLIFIRVSLVFGMILTLFFAWHLKASTSPILALSGIVSFFYIARLPFKKGGINLRDIPGLKIFLIGIVWMLTAVYLPFVQAARFIDFDAHLLGLASLIYIISITIPFDIRDVNVDEVTKKTIPQFLGIRKAKIISTGLMIGYLLILSIITRGAFLPFSYFGGFTALLLVRISKPSMANELHYSLAIDGLLILQPLLLWLDLL